MNIFKEVRDSAARLLRGERCVLVQLDEDDFGGNFTTVSGEIQANFNQAMARHAVATGQVVVDTDDYAVGEVPCRSACAVLALRRRSLCAASPPLVSMWIIAR